MVHLYQRYHTLRKGELAVVDEEEDGGESHALDLVCGNSGYRKKRRPNSLLSVLLLSLLSGTLVLVPQLLTSSSTFYLLYSFRNEDANASVCDSIPNGTICCDRRSKRSDICVMKGDLRTNSASSSIWLYASNSSNESIYYTHGLLEEERLEEIRREKIKPYTRKWETSVMDTVTELDLILVKEEGRSGSSSSSHHRHCDVQHNVPAVFFSTGGYTGNLYHEFNDGILPLYITSQRFGKNVVFVILDYHNWWYTKYGDILGLLSNYPLIDFKGDNRTHCFPEAIVGLRIHDELTVDSSLIEGNKTIHDFRDLLDQAYWPRICGLIEDEEREAKLSIEKLSLSPLASPSSSPSSPSSPSSSSSSSSSSPSSSSIDMVEENRGRKRPKLVILSRNGSRAISNEDTMVKMAEDIGFQVEILRPQRTSELAKIYRSLNSSDVLVGVHGAAMTHFLFMRTGSVFIQVIPLGTAWAAKTYYGEPATRLGLKYIGYEILPEESSLSNDYDKDDPVLKDPETVNKKGWEFTKKIYLDRQTVILNLKRFRKRLVRAYYYSIATKNRNFRLLGSL